MSELKTKIFEILSKYLKNVPMSEKNSTGLINELTMLKTTAPRLLPVLLFQEDGYDDWVAQCLEHDIATQGKNKQEALDRLERTILGQIILDTQDGIDPLSEIEPPPPNFLNLQPITDESKVEFTDSTFPFPACTKCGRTVSAHPYPNCTMAHSTLT